MTGDAAPEPCDPKRADCLHGKVVIVTGAAGGIGGCIGRFFAACGAAVMLADIRAAEAAALAQSLRREGHRAAAVALDILDPESARGMAAATIEEFGGIDVLISCAGIDAPRGRDWELDDEHWRRVIDPDLSGSWWCGKAVIPHMIERRSGRIIFIGSDVSRRGHPAISAAYPAAKAGPNGLTFRLAKQPEPHGVPGNTRRP